MRLYVKFEDRKDDPEPMNFDSKPIIRIGTLIWLLVFAVLAVLYPALADSGLQWWLHTSVVGIALGLVGLWIIRND